MDETLVKPSREVKDGDVISVHLGAITKTLLIIKAIDKRVSAKLVPEAMEDLTPQAKYDKLKLQKEVNHEYRQKGLGRPTKKSRRLIDHLKHELKK